jgi:C-terminal processing protease CtpA/Prc
MSRRACLACLAVLALLFVPAGLHAQAAPRDCTTLGQTTFVRDALQDIYYWYRELPALDPALVDSPEAYLEAVRYRPLDASFSYITGRQASDAFYSDSQFVGLGLGTRLVSSDVMRVTQVFPGSPAADAGLERGDYIVAIGGRAIGDLYASGDLGSAFGPGDVGVTVVLRVRARAGGERELTLVKRLVTIPTVSDVRVVDVDGRRVGYLHFRNFVRPSTEALDAAFGDLAAAGVTDLVLDLRYNGGGLVSVAQHLAGLIGGTRTNAQVFLEFFHNDKNAWRNETLRFEDPAGALDLPRLVVVTTRASASASELIINALRPFLPVTVVGDTTFGKPVGQYGLNFCDKVLFPVAFTLRNARGEGDYFAGFAPDCPAPDDLEHALGDPAEASLGEALQFVRSGSCSAASRSLRRLGPGERPRVSVSGWQTLVGAY